MMFFISYLLLFCVSGYVCASTAYLVFLALAYFLKPEQRGTPAEEFSRFAVLIPAHNEEMLIEKTCQSLLGISYPKVLYEIFVIADNCTDQTADLCRRQGVTVLERTDPALQGKGYALSWAIKALDLDRFDAVLVVDADSLVDPSILDELNTFVKSGELAIQCCNAVRNREESWFTQLLFVSRTIGNLLYHHAKYKLGLSSYLMGNGTCFSTQLLKTEGWTAYSIGEDWEYYATLIEKRIKIAFAVGAIVYHQESRSLEQATTQRLRWSSGRFHVVRRFGLRLFCRGFARQDLFLIDASLPLIFPNYSLLFNLTLLTLLLAAVAPPSSSKFFFLGLSTVCILAQMALFAVGAVLSGQKWSVLKAAMRAPLFLLWKLSIDFLTLTRLHKPKSWVRTQRHQPTDLN
jgi:cellulose synthase/poly-beta-1,6-N-acetylglucosamine synthase-like glycosyltransferase